MATLKDGGDAAKGDQRGKRGGTKGQSSPDMSSLTEASLFMKAVRYSGNINNFIQVSCIVTATNEAV